MNWLDKFFGKTSLRREKTTKIKLSSLESWLREKEKREKREIEEKAAPLIQEILEIMEEMRELALDLKKAKVSSELPKRVKKVIKTSTPDFVDDLLRNTKISEKSSVEKFEQEFSECLDKIGRLLASKGRYLPLAFPDQVEGIRKRAKKLLAYQKELQEISEKDTSPSYLLYKYRQLEKAEQELKNLKQLREKEEKKLHQMENYLHTLKERYQEISKSKKMKEFLLEREKENKLLQEKKKVENELYNLLSPLKRPLKKFGKKLQQEGKNSKRVQRYFKDPVNQFLNDDEEKLLDILKEIANQEKNLNLKPQDLGKVKGVLEKFNQGRELKESYLTLNSKEKRIHQNVISSEVMKEREELMHELEGVKRKLEIERKELEKINEKERKKGKEIKKLKKELQEGVIEMEKKKIEIDFAS